jgi:hypothetical protein
MTVTNRSEVRTIRWPKKGAKANIITRLCLRPVGDVTVMLSKGCNVGLKHRKSW